MCNAHIDYKKTCLKENLTPTYTKLSKNTYTNNTAALNEKAKAQTIRIKQEIRLLHKKKQVLNSELYKTHLHNANTWDRTWDNIEHTINTKLRTEMTKKYTQQHQKLYRLRSKHTQQTDKKQQQFCPKACNQSGVHFIEDEIQLLS
jgi:hypothetical protein